MLMRMTLINLRLSFQLVNFGSPGPKIGCTSFKIPSQFQASSASLGMPAFALCGDVAPGELNTIRDGYCNGVRNASSGAGR